MSCRIPITILVIYAICCSAVMAQTDAHYWTYQYGAKGLLLNGAVVADPGDETSLYYNPGSIGRGDNLGFAISFLTPNYSKLTTSNLLGYDKSYDDTGFDLAPGFFAVRFRPFDTQDLTFGITTFERFKSSVRYVDRTVALSTDEVPDLFRSDFDYNRDLSQSWYGLGFAYNFSDRFALGMTQFVVFHDETLSLDIRRELYGVTMPDVLTVGNRTDIFYNISFEGAMITKAGLSYVDRGYKLGLTYTSSLYGNFRNDADYSIDVLSKDERRPTTISSNRPQIELNDFQMPWSVAFGVQFELEKWNFYLSGEYFSKIDEYYIIDDLEDPFDGLIENTELIPFRISYRNRSVFNVALGIQKKLNNEQSLLFGFRTDFNESSNFNLNDELSFASTNPSIFHFSGGGLFQIGRNKISAGLDLGLGHRNNGVQIYDNVPINRDNLLELGTQTNATSDYYSLTIFLTYDFIFSSFDSIED